MNYLVSIAAAISLTIYFVEITRLPFKIGLNFKPFNCVPCLCFWLTLLFLYLPIEVGAVLLTATLAAIIAAIISIKL